MLIDVLCGLFGGDEAIADGLEWNEKEDERVGAEDVDVEGEWSLRDGRVVAAATSSELRLDGVSPEPC